MINVLENVLSTFITVNGSSKCIALQKPSKSPIVRERARERPHKGCWYLKSQCRGQTGGPSGESLDSGTEAGGGNQPYHPAQTMRRETNQTLETTGLKSNWRYLRFD